MESESLSNEADGGSDNDIVIQKDLILPLIQVLKLRQRLIPGARID